jgi:hypothetical protein
MLHRGQYHLRHSFITNALSAGEDLGWVSSVVGTTDEMIWRHYRRWIPSMRPTSGRSFVEAMDPERSARRSADHAEGEKVQANQRVGEWRRGELNPRPKALRRKLLHA